LFLEQFGYGFGFTAYMLFLMYFARGAQKTSHYAICTGFMALSLMGPQMVSGYVKASLGFQGFFGYILACTIPSFLVSAWAWSNKEFIDYFPPAASK
jgi:PAT family beta-lactamase induction signal transducer AmpG